MELPFYPQPKPKFKRLKPKRSQHTRITQNVRKEVLSRSGGYCERCGKSQAYAFEMAHLIQAGQGGSGREPWNVALLCGPSVNTGTCHNWIDYTKAGRQWALEYREHLKRMYRA